jgi:hypothetical protein
MSASTSWRIQVNRTPATHREIVMLLCGVGWGLFAAASLLSDLHRQEIRRVVARANVDGYQEALADREERDRREKEAGIDELD